MVNNVYGIIIAVCKEVVSERVIASTTNNFRSICIDKPASLGVVVAGLEVVQSCLGIIVVLTIADGIVNTKSGCK